MGCPFRLPTPGARRVVAMVTSTMPPRKLTSQSLRKAAARGAGQSGSNNTCVVLLNHDLPKCTEHLWKQATTRVCADGGATRLRDLGIENCPAPHFVVGDLDSVTRETLDYFQTKGTKIVDLSPDQDTTDLDKCYRVVQEHTDLWDRETDVLLILGGFGGKWDREMSNLHVMLKYSELSAILVGDASVARVLLPGASEIHLDPEVEGPGCSLVPLGQECLVTTEGLKWNLRKQKLSFGHLVSTSNVAEAATVLVETDKPLIWVADANINDRC